MISTRSAGLLIDTVVCLTLAKWETVSGRFGGYLILADAHRSRLTNKWFQQPRQLAGSQLVRSPFVLWAAPVAKIIVLLGHSCSKNLALHAIEIPRIKDRLADIERPDGRVLI